MGQRGIHIPQLALVVLCLARAASPVIAAQGISGIQAEYDNLSDTSDDYSTVGGGGDFPPANTYNMSFNVGSQNNLQITGFEVGTNVYRYIQLADGINLARVDNVVATGSHHIILYEQSAIGGGDVDIKPSYVSVMEDSLRSANVNRGADNVFCNQGDGNGNNNNIERIDYIFSDGYPLHDNIHIRGFLIMDRGGNDPFQIAAVTNLDASGNAIGFTPSVSLVPADWGWSGIDLNTVVLRGYTEGGDPQHPSANVSVQPLDGIFIPWIDFGLQTNAMIYGYAIRANDMATNTSWSNVSAYPTDTAGTGDGGLDLMSGGAMFFSDTLNSSLGDFVWDDWDGDGIQDAGEPGLSNILVYVYDTQTNLAAVTRTDADGEYIIRGLAPGLYFASFVLPTNYSFSPIDQSGDDATDSDANTNTGWTATFTVTNAVTNTFVDAGMHLDPTDLAVTKTVDDNNPNVGDTITFTVVITNNGPDSAGFVQVTDLLPGGLSFNSATPGTGSYTDTNGVWDIGTLNVGASATLTLSADVDSGYGGRLLTNRAARTRADRPDSNPLNDSDTALITIQLADVGVAKTVDDSQPDEGDGIVYTIVATNNGPDAAENVEITDALPSGVTFVSAVPAQGTYDSVSGVWTVGTLNVGASVSLTLNATVDVGSGGLTITNTVEVTAMDQEDADPANDDDDAVIVVNGADVGVRKSVDRSGPMEGDTVIFTITVTNNGPRIATGIEVTDQLPSGVTYSTHSADRGAYDTVSGIWTVGTLNVDAEASLSLTATVDGGTKGTVLTNSAAVTARDLPDPVSANDQDDAVIQVSELLVNKASDVSGSAAPGDTVTYTITITNSGAGAQTGIDVYDLLPTGVTYVANSTVILVNDPGTNVTTNITTNVVIQTVRDQFDSQSFSNNDGSNNWANSWQEDNESDGATAGEVEVVTDGAESYVLEIAGDRNANPPPAAERQVDISGYTNAVLSFTYRRNGLDSANEYVAIEVSSNGGGSWTELDRFAGAATDGSYISWSNDITSYIANNTAIRFVAAQNSQFRSWDRVYFDDVEIEYSRTDTTTNILTNVVGVVTNSGGAPPSLAGGYTLSAGRDMTVSFQVVIDNPTTFTQVVNTVSVTSDQQVEPVLASVADPIVAADVGIAKTVNNPAPNEGDTITFSLVLTNNGPSTATGVEVTDVLPTGLTFGSATPGQGTYDDVSGIWTVGTVSVGGSASLTMSATVDGGTINSIFTNTATITSRDLQDPVAANDSDSVLINVSGLEVTKTSDVSGTILPGSNITYTIVVTNIGSSAQTGITVTDPLPTGVSYVAASTWVVAPGASANVRDEFNAVAFTNNDGSVNWLRAWVDNEPYGSVGPVGDYIDVNGGRMRLHYMWEEYVDRSVDLSGYDSATLTFDWETDGLDANEFLSMTISTNGAAPFVTLGDFGGTASGSASYDISQYMSTGTVIRIDNVNENWESGEYGYIDDVDITFSSSGVTTNAGGAPPALASGYTLDAGESMTITFEVTVDNPTTYTQVVNTVSVTSDLQLVAITDTVSDPVGGVDIGVVKSVDNATPIETTSIEYSLVVSNNGPLAASGVVVTDSLPSGVTFTGSSASQGSYNDATGLWTVGALSVGGSATLTLSADVDVGTGGTVITNIATVSAVDQPDSDPANDTSSATLSPTTSELSIDKLSDAGGVVSFGDTIGYTVIVTNTGSSPQTGLTVADLAPTGTTFDAGSTLVTAPYSTNATFRDEFLSRSYANNNGNAAWNGTWTENEGDGAQAGNIEIRFDNQGIETYMLQFSGPNNWIRREADLSGYTNATLTFRYRRESLEAGEYVAIEVATNGATGGWTELDRFDGAATDASYTYTSYDISAYRATNTGIRFSTASGTMAADDIVWFDDVEIAGGRRFTNTVAGSDAPTLSSGNELAPGEVMTITFSVTVDDPLDVSITQIVNNASVTSDQQGDPIRASVTDQVAAIDLAVTKVPNKYDKYGTNEVVLYTITLTNNGPYNATAVELSEMWPDEVTYEGAGVSQGAYNGGSHTWSVGDVLVNGSATLILTGRVNTSSDVYITNSVAITYLRQHDTNPVNDTNQAVIATPVIVSSFEAFAVEGGVLAVWETASEIHTIGFYLERWDPAAGAYVRVTEDLLPGLLTAPQGGTYEYLDVDVAQAGALRYRLIEVTSDGNELTYGPFEVVPQARKASRTPAGLIRDSALKRERARTVTRHGRAGGRYSASPRSASSMALSRRLDVELDEEKEPLPDDWWGDVIKLGVREKGLYFVSRDEIGAWLNLPDNALGSLLTGGHLNLKSRGVPVAWRLADGSEGLYFYGEPVDGLYTDRNIYWLAWGNRSVMTTVNGGKPDPVAEKVFADKVELEEDTWASAGLFDDPEADYWLWEYFVAGDANRGEASFMFDLPGLAATGAAEVVVRLQGASSSGVEDEHHAAVSVNGYTLGNMYWKGEASCVQTVACSRAWIAEASNTLTVTAVKDAGVPYSIFALDGFAVAYSRRTTVEDDQLEVTGIDGVCTVTGLSTSKVHVLEVGDPSNPIEVTRYTVEANGDAYSVSFDVESDTNRYFVCAEPAVRRMIDVSAAEPTKLTARRTQVDYIIIAPETIVPAARKLARYRESQGWRTRVVPMQHVYDAFNYGIEEPVAIRNFLEHAYTYWQLPPEAVVLAGKGTYDYRNIQGHGDNLVPVHLVGTPDGLFASDSWFADVVGNDGVPEIAIGRLPVLSAAEMSNVVDKIIGYEQPPKPWARRTLFVADNKDSGGDFTAYSDRLRTGVGTAYPASDLSLEYVESGDARSELLDRWSRGLWWVNYIGHGGLDRVGQEGLITSADVPDLDNGVQLPVFVGTSCLLGRFSLPGYDCLAETLIMEPDGGAIAVWAPSGMSYNDPACRLNEELIQAVFGEGRYLLGEAMLSAIEAYADEEDAWYLIEVYNLLGDPATLLR
jgi:uncharacterized repeat protein (TIGR01451 family)